MSSILETIFRAISNYCCGTTAKEEAARRPTEAAPHPLQDDIYVPPVVPHKPYIPGTGTATEQYQMTYPIASPQPQPQPQPHLQSPRPHAPSSPPPPISPPRFHQNQANHENPHYTSLRARASDEGAQMARCFEESHAAYARGDGARAKELSNEGKAHQREMERLNAQASEWIFTENNKSCTPGEVDLHGLYVKEAIMFADRVIQDAKQRGDPELRLIVGKGLHSPHGVAKLKPAVEDLMQKHGLVAELDERNEGVLIVNLDGRPSGQGRVIQPDDIARALERRDDGCLVM